MGSVEQARLLVGQAILKTLVYSDLFDFPLTKEEIWNYLIVGKKVNKSDFEKALTNLEKINITQKSGYYSLAGRELTILKRRKNLKEITRKMEIAVKTANYLKHIPTILFIGLSGGLAIGDATGKDDIDFFIITKSGKIYQTRFWTLVFLELLGKRRKKFDKDTKDKICVNYLIDETKLQFPPEFHDLYIAHEIAQLKPLYDRNNTYSKFINKNMWIKNFLVNFEEENKEIYDRTPERITLLKIIGSILTILPLESLLRIIQISYMGRAMVVENVTKHLLAFHPNDYRVHTLKKMNLKLQELGLLTKI